MNRAVAGRSEMLIPAAANADAPVAAAGACRHCGLPTGAPESAFCCSGCAGAYSLIHQLGLDSFYQARRAASPALAELAPADLSDWVRTDPAGTCSLTANIDGVTCAACVWLVERALAATPGVTAARVNLTTRRLNLTWTGGRERLGELSDRIRLLGYRLAPSDASDQLSADAAQSRELLGAMAVAGFAAMNIMLLSVSVWAGHTQGMGEATRSFMHWLSALIALPTVAYAGRPFFKSALRAIRAGHTNMDVPISVGVTLASAMSIVETMRQGQHAYFDGAVMLLFFLLIGRYLDARARGRARSAVAHLAALARSPVSVVEADGRVAARAASRVPLGAQILVAAGERIGVDGCIVQGDTTLDTSLVTGEMAARPAAVGDRVFAGTVNLTAPLRIATTAIGDATLLAEMIRLMEAAEQGRARHVALAERVARAYTPLVHGLALATFLVWTLLLGMAWQPALLIAVTVLIITCPCALALAVPAVQVAAADRLMRQGILLKSATALERLASVDTLVLDKTGTLTEGALALVEEPGRPAEALAAAARLARASRHPLARALADAAGPGLPADGVREVPGRGLELAEATGTIRLGSRAFCAVDADAASTAPELWLARPGQAPVRFEFADRLRADAAAVVRQLAADGLAVELLSGDRAGAVAAQAAATGIGHWRAETDPAGKCARLAELQAAGRHVLMVGDGLNDAAALAAANVSLSPSSAADIAQTAADAVFQGRLLMPVAEILRVARLARRLVGQNLAFALGYNLLAVPLAMTGHVTPLVAAIAMSSSSLVVMLNALRAGRRSA